MKKEYVKHDEEFKKICLKTWHKSSNVIKVYFANTDYIDIQYLIIGY